ELRTIRREPAEGDRGRDRHPVRYPGSAPLCGRKGHLRERRHDVTGAREVEGALGASQVGRVYRRPRQGSGVPETGAGQRPDQIGEQFAENLQREIEAERGIRFGILAAHHFVAVKDTSASGDMTSLGLEKSKALWEHFRSAGYIDARGNVQESLKQALASGHI